MKKKVKVQAEAVKTGIRFALNRAGSSRKLSEILNETKSLFYEEDAINQDLKAKEKREKVVEESANHYSFELNTKRITITKIDKRPAETEIGADMIYHAVQDNKFIVVQHKIIEDRNSKVYASSHIADQANKLMRVCGNIGLNMGNFQFQCHENYIETLSDAQLDDAIIKIRLMGYCSSFFKICFRRNTVNGSRDKLSSGVIYPACIASLFFKKNGFLWPKSNYKGILHTELENMFSNCLIGLHETSQIPLATDSPATKFIFKETEMEQRV